MDWRNQFERPRKWARMSLLGALPAWAVLILLVLGGSLAFRNALLGGLLAAVLSGLVVWRPARLRDALRRRIDALATGETDPGRPLRSDGLNWAFERMVQVWREKIGLLAAESLERPQIMDAMPDPVLLIDGDKAIAAIEEVA